jgi:hypothetical protein
MLNMAFAIMLILPLASHTYCWHEFGCFRYNCQDFSYSAIMTLRQNNFTAYAIHGWVEHREHNWIAIELNGTIHHIEPQMAVEIYPSSVAFEE